MRRLPWAFAFALLGCDGLYVTNPDNCVENANACTQDESCNTVTQRCETLDCTINTALCSGGDVCDPTTHRCQTVSFVLGQPDEGSNLNVSYGLSAPQAALLVPDGAGNTRVVVGDTGNHRVLIWNDVPTQNRPADAVLGMPDVSTLSATGPYGGFTQSSMQSPVSLASDGTSLVVADLSLNRMLIWNQIPNQLSNGSPIPATGIWGQSDYTKVVANQGNGTGMGISSTGVSGPLVAFDVPGSGTNRFFVADSQNSRVLVFDNGIPTSWSTPPSHLIGNTSYTTRSPGCSRQKLNTPLGMAVGNCPAMPTTGCPLFVADSANNRVVGYAPAQFTSSPPNITYLIGQNDFGTCTPEHGNANVTMSTLLNPQSVCYSNTLKALFVADTGNNRVLGFTTLTAIGPNGSPPTAYPTATYLLGQAAFGDSAANGPTGMPSAATMSAPTDVRCDDSHIIVADTGNNRTLIWSNLSALAANKMGLAADVVLGQPSPTSVVADMPSPDGVLHFNNPMDVASDGNVLAVADSGNHRVLLWLHLPAGGSAMPDVVLGQPDFNPTSNQQNAGMANASNQTLSSPSGVSLENGRLAVSDTGNNRVLIWNRIPSASFAAADVVLGQPDFMSTTTTMMATAATMNSPAGLALWQSGLYVADQGLNRVLIYNDSTKSASNFDLMLGPAGSGPSASTLTGPDGVAVSQGMLFVADSGYQRVLIWNQLPTVTGQAADLVIGQSNFNQVYSSLNRTNLSAPRGVLVHNGRIFVSSPPQNRILYWNQLPTMSGGNADGVLGQLDFFSNLPNTYGVSPIDRVSDPAGLAAVGNQIFIADTLNNRVVVRGLSD